MFWSPCSLTEGFSKEYFGGGPVLLHMGTPGYPAGGRGKQRGQGGGYLHSVPSLAVFWGHQALTVSLHTPLHTW